jgi:uncharacterized protein (DUF4415 family)
VGLRLKEGFVKKKVSDPRVQDQDGERAALAALPNERIDTADIAEQLDWSGARRGVFYRPIKKQLTLRLDADLIEWFRTRADSGEGYQTRINRALRAYVAAHSK